MKVLTKKEERQIKADVKRRGKDDLRMFRKLHSLFRKAYRLESARKMDIKRARKVEEEILKVFSRIRADILAELNYFDMLKPRNDMERALILAFGPFLSPKPAHIREVVRYLRQEGFTMAFISEEPGGPEGMGRPKMKAMYKREPVGEIDLKPDGFYTMFKRAAEKEGKSSLADSWMLGLMDTMGIPESEKPKYAPKTG